MLLSKQMIISDDEKMQFLFLDKKNFGKYYYSMYK